MRRLSAVHAAAVAIALIVMPRFAHAQFTTFNSQAAFAGQFTSIGVDNFNNLPLGLVESPISRMAGPVAYTATAVDVDVRADEDFFNLSIDGDVVLSTNAPMSGIRFNGFSQSIFGAGGFFFTTDQDGNPITGNILVTYTAGGITGTTLLPNTATSTFFGVRANAPITSFTIAPDVDQTNMFATANDFTVGLATVVPEPSTYALVGAGLVALFALRRKRLA